MKTNLLIEELNLSAMSVNVLKKIGIYTVEELLNTPQRKLEKRWPLDYKSLNEIKDKVHSLGFKLKYEKEETIQEEKNEEKEEIGVNTVIEKLDLSTRSYHALKKSEINTLGELINTPQEEIKKLWHLGYKSFNEIRDKIHSLGFLFIDEEEHEENNNTTSIYVGEAGFEVGIGDIEKFDEAERVLENLVEKEKEGGKNKNE